MLLVWIKGCFEDSETNKKIFVTKPGIKIKVFCGDFDIPKCSCEVRLKQNGKQWILEDLKCN